MHTILSFFCLCGLNKNLRTLLNMLSFLVKFSLSLLDAFIFSFLIISHVQTGRRYSAPQNPWENMCAYYCSTENLICA